MLVKLPNPWSLDLTLLKSNVTDEHLSGNKYHKLVGYLAAARAHGIQHLVTMTGAHSNHLRAFAALTRREGFRATAVIRGDELDDPARQSEEIRFALKRGVDCHFVSRARFRELREAAPAITRQFIAHIADGALLIPEGGKGAHALTGVAAWAQEARDFEEIWLPVATGTTAAGFLSGTRAPRIRAVQVLRNAPEVLETIRALVPGEAHRLSLVDTATQFRFGRRSAELTQIAGHFSGLWRINLDHEYMARVLYALQIYMGEPVHSRRILLVNTYNH